MISVSPYGTDLMSAHIDPNSKTQRAIELVDNGAKPYTAAREVGLAPNILYRELAKRRKKLMADEEPRPRSFCGACGQEITRR